MSTTAARIVTKGSDIPLALRGGDALFVALVMAHLLMKIAMAFLMVDVRPSGDEWAYMDAAKALSNAIRDLVHLAPPDIAELKANVIGNGWFMPGMPLLATPLYLVQPDAGIASLRIYLGMTTFALWLWTALVVRRCLGNAYACALLVFPSLVPLWVMFTFTFWGDLCAGLVLTILLVHAYVMARRLRAGAAPSLQQAVTLGALAAAALYLRSSTLPLIPLLFVLMSLAAWLFLAWPVRKKAIAKLAVAGGVFLALLLPWSMAVSTALRAPVLTTTSVPLSLAITFGDKHELCYGPCPRGEIWLTSVRYSREIGLATGRSAVEVQKAMSKHALNDVTTQGYAARVIENLERYLLLPGAFVQRFMPSSHSSPVRKIVSTTTSGLYYLFMGTFLVALIFVARRSFETQAISILVKLFSLSLLLQPFVHVSHGRYWPVFAPFFGLALGLLLHVAVATRQSRGGHVAFATHMPASRLLVLVQTAIVAGTIAIAMALPLLAFF